MFVDDLLAPEPLSPGLRMDDETEPVEQIAVDAAQDARVAGRQKGFVKLPVALPPHVEVRTRIDPHPGLDMRKLVMSRGELRLPADTAVLDRKPRASLLDQDPRPRQIAQVVRRDSADPESALVLEPDKVLGSETDKDFPHRADRATVPGPEDVRLQLAARLEVAA